MLKVGICGFGFMGQMHAGIYRKLAGVECVCVVETAPGALEILRTTYPEIRVYGSLELALAEEKLDAIDLCLPTWLHEEAGLQVIRAGIPLFCEKPLALTVASGRRLVDAAAGAGVPLMVGHCMRFWEEFGILNNFIQSGEAGLLKNLHLYRRTGRPSPDPEHWVNQEALCRGAALDLHIHDVDVLHWLLGVPASVRSCGVHQSSGWDSIATQYEYPGKLVTAEGGWDYPPGWPFRMGYMASFTGGVLEYDSRKGPGVGFYPLNGEARRIEGRGSDQADSFKGGGNISDMGAYYHQLAYFVDCLRKGRAIEINTGLQALQTLAIAEAEITSCESGGKSVCATLGNQQATLS